MGLRLASACPVVMPSCYFVSELMGFGWRILVVLPVSHALHPIKLQSTFGGCNVR